MENIEFMSVSPEDWKILCAISKIETEAFSGDGVTPANLVLMARAGFVFCLRENSAVIAEAIVIPTFSAGTAFLFSFAVGSSDRGKGKGKAFLNQICTFLAGKGVSTLELTVAPENKPAVNLYVNGFGFEKMSFGKDYLGPGHDRMILRKAL